MTAPDEPTGVTPAGTTPPQYGQYSSGQQQMPPPSSYAAPPGSELAHWGWRVAGYLIDFVIIAIPSIVIGLLANNRLVLNLVSFLGTLVIGYLNGAQGQSPGKRVVGLRLVRDTDGQLLGGGMGIVRALCHLLDSFSCLVGWLWPLWDAKRQTFADKIVSTVVLKE